MAVKNEEIVTQKAAITAANTLASSGKLNAAQADKFIDYIVDESMLAKLARTVRFRNESLDIDKIGVGQRVAVPKNEAVDPGVRRGVSTSKVSLTPKEIMVPLEISDNFVETNLEGSSVTEHILRMFARQLANDLEELQIHGNTGGYLAFEGDIVDGGSTADVVVDSYLSLFDGFLKLADGGNVVDAGGDPLSTGLFRQMLSAMPTKFKKNKSLLRWFVPVELEELWRERMSTRATNYGDAMVNGSGNITPFGIEMVPVSLMEMYPQQVKTASFAGSGTTIQLDFAPIQNGSVVIIKESNADSYPTTPYVEGVDYSVNYNTGVITHIAAAGIGNTESVRISHRSMPQILLTTASNLIIGIGRDIRIESDRDIFRTVNQYATTVKMAVQLEEVTAIVKAKNVSDSL
jgi:hypothetical protein